MNLPTREELLAEVDKRFRELAPSAPKHLDPNDASHQELIKQWWQAHHEVLSRMTDEAFFAYYPTAPEKLDTSNPDHAKYVEYWKDIANQINGEQGTYDWSKAEVPDVYEPIEMPAQDGSVRLDQNIEYVKLLMGNYAQAVGATPLGPKVIDHTMKQIEALRGLVNDGTFQTYDHWWRSASFSDAIYDEEDKNEQIAFVRDLTLEAKIDRSTGELDLHLAGWATDFKKSDGHFGRVSRAN